VRKLIELQYERVRLGRDQLPEIWAAHERAVVQRTGLLILLQAGEYEEWDSGWDRARRFFVELELTHDYPVRRASELMRWVRSGEYDRIIGGDYARRTDPVDVGA
jgi:hypothetical protein